MASDLFVKPHLLRDSLPPPTHLTSLGTKEPPQSRIDHVQWHSCGGTLVVSLCQGHPRAYRLLETALSIRTSVFGPNSLAVADVHRALGDTFAAHNDMAHAESHFNSALDIYNLRAENVDASEAAKCAESIALCHVAVGDREQALDRIAQAVIRAETDLGAKHPDLLRLQVVECTLRQSC